MIDEPHHNLDGSSDAETTPTEPEPLPPGQTFHHTPQLPEMDLPPQDLMPPLPEAMSPEQAPYASPFGQMPPPPIEQMPPPPGPPSGGTGYAAPNAWPATPPAQPPTIVTQAVRSEFPLRTVLLIAVPICIIAVGIAIYLFNNNAEDEPLPATPAAVSKVPATGPVGAPAATTFAAGSGNGTLSPAGAGGGGGASSPTPPAAPVVLGAGGTGGGGGSATNSGLAGRWLSRQPDFYQFNADGSGSHGTAPGSKPSQTFNWTVQSHEVKIYPQGGAPQESLAFSFGPDAKSVFLRQPDGKFREYALVTNSDSGG